MIRQVIVLGAGSAGLLAALALRRKLPQLAVRVIRSPEIGVIGVGEGTTPLFPQFLFNFLGLDRREFFEIAQPTWKLGGRFLWGPRKWFDYPFEVTFEAQVKGLPRPNGFYCEGDYHFINLPTAMMTMDKAFPRRPDGSPDLREYYAFHIENQRLVNFLEKAALAAGVTITDAKVLQVETDADHVKSLQLDTGEHATADLYLDASGFRSILLGKALSVPFISFSDSLFCDRAIIGGWPRTTEPIKPYTTQETMDAGWCWQIEHETFINRGYVYSSAFISDDAAQAEFLAKNPNVQPEATRVVKFTSGRRQLAWKGNVIAIGNAYAFVEPLEATALNNLALQLKLLVQTLWHSHLEPPPTMAAIYNLRCANWWDDTRDFLALHYRFNTRLDTPFWQTCRTETDLRFLEDFLAFYRENGPTLMAIHALPQARAIYGLDGHLAVLVGCKVPYQSRTRPTAEEWFRWSEMEAHHRKIAATAMNVKESLDHVRHPAWSWNAPQPPRTALRL